METEWGYKAFIVKVASSSLRIAQGSSQIKQIIEDGVWLIEDKKEKRKFLSLCSCEMLWPGYLGIRNVIC